MKALLLFLFLTVGSSAIAQQRLASTIWADGLINPQAAQSNLYAPGAGGRFELSRPLRNPTRSLFAQVGYAHFFRKQAGAFIADVGLVNVGYRYQSRKAFSASAGVGVQYWRERLRIRLTDASIAETLTTLTPSATVGVGLRVRSRYRLGLENRVLVNPEPGRVSVRNNVALSIGYTF